MIANAALICAAVGILLSLAILRLIYTGPRRHRSRMLVPAWVLFGLAVVIFTNAVLVHADVDWMSKFTSAR